MTPEVQRARLRRPVKFAIGVLIFVAGLVPSIVHRDIKPSNAPLVSGTGTAVDPMRLDCGTGQVLMWDGRTWACVNP